MPSRARLLSLAAPLSLAALAGWVGGCEGEDKSDDPSEAIDLDGDGHGRNDCDDRDPAVYPGAVELWYDGVDQDCSGGSDYDADSDGHDAARHDGDDCNDRDDSIHPGATEVWYDGVDSDCSDRDRDGFESDEHGGRDCDDRDPAVHPAAEDVWYDGVDTDCGGNDDNDADGDGHAARDLGGDDCDDADPAVFPGADEVWYDGIDSDCAGDNDNDADQDGYAAADRGGLDCDDAEPGISPAAEETCDEVDNDCDGETDEADAIDGPCTRLVEDFESGIWPATSWTTVSTNNGLLTSTAYEGNWALYDATWSYNEDVRAVAGSVIGMWIRVPPSGGRVYLGFDATSAGARSFVVAPNTGDIRFQTNVGYGYVELTTAATYIPRSQWLYMELELSSSVSAVGRLYNASGTLVESVSHTWSTPIAGGGVAIQSFGGISMDYLTFQ